MHSVYGNFPPGTPDTLSPEEQAMQQGMLGEFTISDDTFREVLLAKMWDDILAKRGAPRPKTLLGIERLSDLMWFSGKLAPMRLCEPFMIKRLGEEKAEKMREETELALSGWLSARGF
jgi:hypothetical protein